MIRTLPAPFPGGGLEGNPPGAGGGGGGGGGGMVVGGRGVYVMKQCARCEFD